MPRPAASTVHIEVTPRGLRLPAAHAYVGVGQSKFLELVETGKMPRPSHLSGCILWDRRALDRALDELFEAQSEPEGLPDGRPIIL